MERATFGVRALALIIDIIIVVLAFFILGTLGIVSLASLTTSGGVAGAGIFVTLFSGALVVAYYLMEVFWAQTPGKMAMKLIIRDEDGNPASRETLLKRWAIKLSGNLLQLIAVVTTIGLLATLGTIASLIITLGMLLALGADRQTLHDKLAKTAVFRQGQ